MRRGGEGRECYSKLHAVNNAVYCCALLLSGPSEARVTLEISSMYVWITAAQTRSDSAPKRRETNFPEQSPPARLCVCKYVPSKEIRRCCLGFE